MKLTFNVTQADFALASKNQLEDYRGRKQGIGVGCLIACSVGARLRELTGKTVWVTREVISLWDTSKRMAMIGIPVNIPLPQNVRDVIRRFDGRRYLTPEGTLPDGRVPPSPPSYYEVFQPSPSYYAVFQTVLVRHRTAG